MRICSLLPSATEMVYALGLGDQLVGVSHACDYPEDAASKPVVSRSLRGISHLDSAEIDGIIQQARTNNNPLYWIDGDLLRDLKPDLIITQELCEVCAVGSGSVFETAAKVLDYQPIIITVRPAGLEDIFQNILNIGQAAQVPNRAQELVEDLRGRVAHVQSRLPDTMPRPKVFCIDWLDPLRNTGQWVPELVELAGGQEGLAIKWGKSREIAWEEVLAYQPDFLMSMPCAFDSATGGPGVAGTLSIPARLELPVCGTKGSSLFFRRAYSQQVRAKGHRCHGGPGGSDTPGAVLRPGPRGNFHQG